MRKCRQKHLNTKMDLKSILHITLWISFSLFWSCQSLPYPLPQSNHHNSFAPNFAVSEFGAPLITPLLEEVILEKFSNYTLRCEANQPISWRVASYHQNHEIKTFATLDPDRPYGSMLYLFEVENKNVGNYYCYIQSQLKHNINDALDKDFVDLLNINAASSIYIFVNDRDNLLVPMDPVSGNVHQYEDIIIPCKPTIPSVDVLLTTPDDETLESATTRRYDPRRGFVILIKGIHDSGSYYCRPKVPSLNNEEELQQTYLQFVGNDPNTDMSTTYVNKPNIMSASAGHAYVGDTFHLNCTVHTPFDVLFSMNWTVPEPVEQSRMELQSPTKVGLSNGTMGITTLTIHNAKKTDSGIYACSVFDHSRNSAKNKYTMTILDRNESYINLTEPNGYYNIREKANSSVQMTINYRGFPIPSLTWFDPNGNEIRNNGKFEIISLNGKSTLKILHVQTLDSGNYEVLAENGIITKKLKFNVSISDTPDASVEDVYVQVGEEAHLVCRVFSYPIAVVTWLFTPCSIHPRWPACESDKFIQGFNSSRSGRRGNSSYEYFHELYFMPRKPGIMRCVAINEIGRTIAKGHVLLGDISSNVSVYGVDESQKIARGDEVTITCAALAYYIAEDIEWFKDGDLVLPDENIEIYRNNSQYSYKKVIKFNRIRDKDQGSYECRAKSLLDHNEEESKYVQLFVHEPKAPSFSYTNLNDDSKIERKLGETLELFCKSEAIPKANIQWLKDEVEVVQLNDSNIILEEENTKLIIPFIKPENEGIYRCIISNRLGRDEASVKVKITNMPGVKTGWILGALFFFIILIALIIYLVVRVKRERALLKVLKASGLANFEEGAVEHINRALNVDEQADLLPYDRRFEFPRDKLKLGKQLGAGAFGVVHKALAEGIKTEEKESVVAVKMVKRTADNEVMRALVSELKIMVHLGQHLNVVNLLGAVTKNIAKRQLMVIVEYCRYGNVQNFLLRNRKRFINQVNPLTNKIDPTIITQRFSDNFEYPSSRPTSDNDPRPGTRGGRPNSRGYLRQSDLYEGHVDSAATEQTVMTTVPEDDDNVLSNNSIQPAWRSNYRPDTNEAMTVTTSDLVSWAFQIARGMEYLSSRKVLHGDLAARNILLCEDNIVKICDFGLARSMYKSDNYKKQGEAPLPIKWLALESLSDHVFSTYTDVWSYGIVLWELFSLAKVPYPGMDPTQSLYLKLKDGYRMEQPPYANDELYDIMLECWRTNPESRPLFNVLEKRFAQMLGEEVATHYVDLNEPYLNANTNYMRQTQTDYLGLMGCPEEMAPAAPPARYVNGHMLPEIRIDPSSDGDGGDELQMNTNIGTCIFSPTRTTSPKEDLIEDDEAITTTSFTFPEHSSSDSPPKQITVLAQQHSPTLINNLDSPTYKKRNKAGIQPEEIPMLHSGIPNSDEEEASPSQKRRNNEFSSRPTPMPRNHVAETKLVGDDNYVNVKPPRKHLNNNNNNNGRTVDAVSNPGYQVLKTGGIQGDNK